MAHLIDKSALVSEIERRTDELWALIPDGEKVFSNKHTKEDAFNLGKYTALESLDKFINILEVIEINVDLGDPKGDKSAKYIIDTYTHEVKEIDLEKEIKEEYLKRRCYGGRDNMLVILNEPQFNKIVKYFFELGMQVSNKAQKGK